jgi:proline-rich protein PRCC
VPGSSNISLKVSSAPKIEDFVPPEPTPNDEYPGYYKLPTGTWAAYDPDYYQSFYKKWQKEYNNYVRALEKGAKGFEQYDEEEASEVDAAAEMERAKIEVQEREERKALTQGDDGEPAKPRMNIQVRPSLSVMLRTSIC